MLCLPTVWAYSLLGPVAQRRRCLAGAGKWFQSAQHRTARRRRFSLTRSRSGPKNLGEEYRRNTPVLYYAADANFLDYFGSNGVVAIDQAFAILNALTNVDLYSPGLTEFSLNSEAVNYTGAGLGFAGSQVVHAGFDDGAIGIGGCHPLYLGVA